MHNTEKWPFENDLTYGISIKPWNMKQIYQTPEKKETLSFRFDGRLNVICNNSIHEQEFVWYSLSELC